MNGFLYKLAKVLGIDPSQRDFASLLLNALGITDQQEEMTDDQAIALILEKAAENLAKTAQVQGKIAAHDLDWFRTETRRLGIPTMVAFLKYRAKQPALMARLEHGGRPGAIEIDQLQEGMNQLMGVSRETFLKYNGGKLKS